MSDHYAIAPPGSHASDWIDSEAARAEREELRIAEERDTERYLTETAGALARSLVTPHGQALGDSKRLAREVLKRVWLESARVAELHRTLGVKLRD